MHDTHQRPLGFLISLIKRDRFAVLLFALLLLFLSGPVVDLFASRLEPVAARVITGIAFSVLLLVAVFTVARTGRSFWMSLLLAIPAIVFEIIDQVVFRTETLVAGHLFSALLLGYVILVLLRFIFETQRVTANTIFASLCVYLLLGTLWALAYSSLEKFQPGAFSYSQVSTEESSNPMRLGAVPAGLEYYFSLVTMTTLGYGDIVPVSSAARSLATLQAVVGQLYLAVLVARLVGLHVAESVRSQ